MKKIIFLARKLERQRKPFFKFIVRLLILHLFWWIFFFLVFYIWKFKEIYLTENIHSNSINGSIKMFFAPIEWKKIFRSCKKKNLFNSPQTLFTLFLSFININSLVLSTDLIQLNSTRCLWWVFVNWVRILF